MRRVVITGIGIVSSIGNNAAEVEASLHAGKSGIVFAPEYAEHGFRCRVHGQPNIVLEDHIDKRDLRFMGDGAAYTFIAMDQAVKDSGLSESDVSNERTGIIMGSGGPSTRTIVQRADGTHGGQAKGAGRFRCGDAASGDRFVNRLCCSVGFCICRARW